LFTALRKFEWEAIAGLVAAVAAIVLHFLHVTDVNVLRVITLVLVALLFLRDLRTDERWRSMESASRLSVRLLEEIKETTHPAEIHLIGPTQLRQATIHFAERAQGEVVWFNACPQMFESKEVCDAILRPFLDNPVSPRSASCSTTRSASPGAPGWKRHSRHTWDAVP
jgi:hypothetical protein